jgi:hypothetical protein
MTTKKQSDYKDLPIKYGFTKKSRFAAYDILKDFLAHPYNPQAEQSCIWTEDEDGIYQTSCGNSFEFMNGTPNDNHTKFCPYCGKVLTQSKGGKP